MHKLFTGMAALALAVSLSACGSTDHSPSEDVAAEGPAAEENVTTVNEVNTIDNVEAQNSGSTDHDL